ncbi:MAG: iron-sulfur cluster assembly scaffold protein [Patescibacteria group bacterium]|jgi:nitrogen fixation NifU-like protein
MNDIYRKIILDHYKYPRNQGEILSPDVEVQEENSSCGDTIKLQLKLNEANCIQEVKFLCQGCAISKAASSLLTETVKGKKLSEVRKLSLNDVYKLMGGPVAIGRVKCAGLGLKALHKAVSIRNISKVKRRKMPKINHITKNTLLGELISQYPKAAQVLVGEYGLHCVGCFAAAYETLQDGAKAHGMSEKGIEDMVKRINEVISESDK